jgi:hypothetical protein
LLGTAISSPDGEDFAKDGLAIAYKTKIKNLEIDVVIHFRAKSVRL